MKFYLILLIFVLISINVNASWQTYQNDLRNAGISNGTGYFPLSTANFSDDNLGMNFQALVDDLDKNGDNEIVIFSNNSLIIFNPQLTILSQAKIGPILGQPTLFNFDNDDLIEILFNSRQDSTDYFFAYQYNNSNLKQEFNITLSNEANFSGIKCLNLNSNPFCVFKDRFNYIHIINISSKTDSSYNTSNFNETRQTVPAIGDIDNDGNVEAVFWLDNDSDNQYGFIAFDLNERKVEWIVDDIYASFSAVFSSSVLKGQPVLVDLNNDNKLEIAASVFYVDTTGNGDWFTELFIYNSSGSKLFSKCEKNPSNNCNDGSSDNNQWEGTNPFVMDFDKNGKDDICFIKDVKAGGNVFQYMALNCYNYSGDEIAKVNLTNDPDGTKGIAMAADMNNDGLKEIVTTNYVYTLNGKAIFSNFQMSKFHTIAVDIDGNNGLDLIWTFGNQTKVFLDNSNYTIDLSVNSFDISFIRFNSTHINVSSIIKNIGQVEVGNIKTIIYNTDTKENKTSILDIRKNGNATLSAVLGLKESEKVMVSVDFDNEINETNEDNNVAEKEFIDLPNVFVSVNEEATITESEFKNYIKNKLTSGYYTENENSADVKVYIGKNNPINIVNNVKTLDEFEFGYDYGNIIYNDKIGTNPYAALVGAFKDSNGKIIVMIVGNEIEGDIAGTKEFIKNQATLLITKDKNSIFIDDENADAIKVFDYLHLGGNNEHYNINNEQFKTIVKNALNDEMFNVFDKSVVTSNGITLRLRNLKPNISSDYLEYLNSSGVPVEMPVVLAHGIFSNLTTWEVLGAEISNIGRDTWLIEITGGPGQDCDNCIDYTFYNLTDIFVPALLNGVLNFTNKDKIQYVGFSNGCRAALDSLERNKFDSNKVETFVAVGCPGAFEGNSTLGSVIAAKDGQIFDRINSRNLKHVSMKDIIAIGLLDRNTISNNKDKISLNLWKFYEDIIRFNNDTQPGKINVSSFVIIQGSAFTSDDGIVTILDEEKIYQNANLNDKPKKRFDIFAVHTTLDVKDRTKSIITKLINKQELSFYERKINLINQSG